MIPSHGGPEIIQVALHDSYVCPHIRADRPLPNRAVHQPGSLHASVLILPSRRRELQEKSSGLGPKRGPRLPYWGGETR